MDAVQRISDESVSKNVANRDNEKVVDISSNVLEGIKDLETVGELLDYCVDQLVMLYERNPHGFIMHSLESQPVRDIGTVLNLQGGKDLMLEAHRMFSNRVSILGAARNLEMVWDGIDGWRG